MDWKKKLIGILFLVLIIGGTSAYLFMQWNFSVGARAGRLVKMSQKGYFYKEWEGTLDLGEGNNLTWDFSVSDDEVGQKLLENLGKTLTLDYQEHLTKFIYGTKYIVTGWHENEMPPAKICPFLYLLHDDPTTQGKAAILIKSKRPDLSGDVDDCLKRTLPRI